jgi:hypothetical protein
VSIRFFEETATFIVVTPRAFDAFIADKALKIFDSAMHMYRRSAVLRVWRYMESNIQIGKIVVTV